MKRLLVTALILSMLGSSAVIAAPYRQDDRGYSRSNNNGAVIAGLSIFALAAILASQNNHRTRYSQYNRGFGGGYNTQAYGRDDNDRGHDMRGYDQGRNDYQSGYSNRGHL